jgi:streptogramin lyase
MFRSTFVCLLFAGILIPAICSTAAPTDSASSTGAARAEPVVYTLGAPLGRPQSLDVDEFGRIYVLDWARQSLMRFLPTGELDRIWRDGTHGAVEPIGRGMVRALPGERILLSAGIFSESGSIRRIGPGPSDDALLPCDPDSGWVIYAADDGSYSLIANDQICKVPNQDEWPLETILCYDADGQPRTKWQMAKGEVPALGPDGLVYGVTWVNPTVTAYDRDGKVRSKIVLDPAPKFISPLYAGSLMFDRNGDIYRLDWDFMCRYDSSGHLLARWKPYQAAGQQAHYFYGGGLWTVRNGLLYLVIDNSGSGAADSNRPPSLEIQVYTPDGQCVQRFVPVRSAIQLPASIAVQSDGSCMLLERGSQWPLVLDPSGARHEVSPRGYSRFVVLAKPGGGFCASSGIDLMLYDNGGQNGKVIYETVQGRDYSDVAQLASDPRSGDIWSLGGAGTLIHLSPEGKLIKQFPVNMELNFRTFSTGMAIDHKGFIYVPNAWRHCVVKVDPDGAVVGKFGKEGARLGELKFPEGLAFDSQDRLYVADSGNCRIQVFDTDGNPLGFFGSQGTGDGQFDRPYGIAMGSKNTLWIADTFNDRIVRVPLDRFWREITKEIKPEPVVEAPKKEPVPSPGQVTVTGIVIAGSDDLTDVIYIESPDRSWGARVTLPTGKAAARGDRVKVTGQLELKERAAKHILAGSVQTLARAEKVPGPLGMANLYVGDGYRSTNRPTDLSNLGLLIKTWGRVVSVEPGKKLFVINDGSYPIDKGLVVYAGNLQSPLAEWPKVG